MSFNVDGLISVLRNAEQSAANAVNGLNGNSTATDLTVASFRSSQYTIIGTAVSQLIKMDGEAKLTPARNMGSR